MQTQIIEQTALEKKIAGQDQRKILFLICLTALTLRLITISSRGIWYDDAFSIFLASASPGEIVRGTAADTMPPLYYFLLHIWMMASTNLVWIRSLNVLLSLGIVLLSYLWIKSLAGVRAGLWAAALTAIAPIQVYHALEIRMYALLTLALMGYAYCCTKMFLSSGKNVRWTWISAILCGTAAMYTHNLAIFSLAVPAVILLFSRRWNALANQLASLAIIAGLSWPWLRMIPAQVEKIQQAFWTPLPGIAEVIQAITILITNLPLKGPLLIIAVVGSLQITFMLIYILNRQRIGGKAVLWLGAFAVIPPLLMLAVSYLMRPVFVPRAFLLSGIALFGLIGLLASNPHVFLVGRVLAVGTLCLGLLGLVPQYLFKEFPRSPFQEASKMLTAKFQPGEIVIHDNKLSAFPMIYYHPEIPQKFLSDIPGGHNDTLAKASQNAIGLFPAATIEEAAGGAGRIYFVVFSKAIQEYKNAGVAQHPILQSLNAMYKLRETQIVGDLEIYTFERG